MLHLFREEAEDSAALFGKDGIIQHSYCRECAVKFVAEQEDHRCPQCRMEYEGSPDAIESSFFQVYEEDGPLY